MTDTPGGPPELLMVERASTMAFAPGAMVFPGGRIDPADHALGEALGVDHGAALVAAVRETIEETAVPIALSPLPDAALAAELQRSLLAERPLAEVIANVLLPWARWLPNLHLARRFDTLFFLAEAPPGEWHPIVGEAENRSAEWLSARATLDRCAAGRASIIFPTRCNLERLALHESVAAMRADAHAHPVETITPWVEEHDGTQWLTIPDHLGYPLCVERLDQSLRG
jgi:8-oxo-dGTP pyrophosphatase MutT (NUDIX family)